MTGIPTHTGNLEENGTENTLKSGWDFGNRDLPALVREVFLKTFICNPQICANKLDRPTNIVKINKYSFHPVIGLMGQAVAELVV